MARVREQWPSARIDVLTSQGRDDAVRALGAAGVIHYFGRSLHLLRHLFLFRRLRRQRYDVVVVPRMYGHADAANLYRAAVCIGARSTAIGAAGQPLAIFERRAFFWFTLQNWFEGVQLAVDIPFFLLLLVLAYLRPRPKPRVSSRTRVLHVITSFGVGGAQVQLAELLARTPRHRYDVEVFVLGRDDGEFSRQWLDRHDIRFYYSAGWPRHSLAALEIAQLCRTEEYDLVHTWLFLANVIGAAGARLGGVPRILGSVRNLSLWKRTWYARWWYRLGDALATRIADLVTVNSSPLVADHAKWTWLRPSRLAVVHNGLDPRRVLSQADGAGQYVRELVGVGANTPLVGIVGRLAPEKDQAAFLATIANVHERHPDLHAIVVGDGALRAELEQRADELGLSGCVHFVGERTDSRRIIAGLDVFVLTSRIEGFPNVLLEAAFLGVPSIATAVGGAVDMLDPDDLAEPGDVDRLSRALSARLEAPDAARFHAAAIRRRAFERFTSDHSTARWLALYDRLLTRTTELDCQLVTADRRLEGDIQ
jgi:glycosyltransferase involved in cell wall biosynthesis